MEFLTTGQAAQICGVGLNTIKNWIKNSHLKAIQLPGGHWRIPVSEFESFLVRMGIDSGAVSASEKPAADTPRILIVDDDEHIHDFVEDACMIGGINADFSFASDGYTGLIKIGQFRPQLLVLDIMMPEINGLELIHRVKSDQELSENMSIIAVTGARDKRLVMHKLEQAGPDAILLKPVSVNLFVEAANRLLGSRLQAGIQHVR